MGASQKMEQLADNSIELVVTSPPYPMIQMWDDILAKQNPEIKKVEISGHTDNIGSFSYNVKLSKNRAKNVVEYLVNNGISTDRLVSEGYAFEYPIAPNSSPEGREKNRRVEFEIIRLQ